MGFSFCSGAALCAYWVMLCNYDVMSCTFWVVKETAQVLVGCRLPRDVAASSVHFV
jgi:hypothetical protein